MTSVAEYENDLTYISKEYLNTLPGLVYSIIKRHLEQGKSVSPWLRESLSIIGNEIYSLIPGKPHVDEFSYNYEDLTEDEWYEIIDFMYFISNKYLDGSSDLYFIETGIKLFALMLKVADIYGWSLRNINKYQYA